MIKIKFWALLLLAGCGLTRPLADENFKLTTDKVSLEHKVQYLSQPGERLDKAPNIIWIIVDDLGIADTDLYGNKGIPVPNLNKLANEGVRFSNAYVTSSICGPSRAAIFTGKYNQRFGFEHQQHDRYLKNKLEYFGFKYFVGSKPWYPQKQDSVPTRSFIQSIGLPDSEITIAEALKKYGYATGLFGKWHLTRDQANGPNNFGFDQYYGFRNSHSLYAQEGTEGIVDMRNKRDWTDKYIWKDQRDNLSAIELNGVIISEDRYLTNAITDEGIAFIKQAKKPFFATFSYNAPHTPFQAPQETIDQWSDIDDPVKRTYAAMITTLDSEIGKIIEYLQSSEQFDNTLICFISDNGGAEYTYATDNGDYKGGKITNFEGGVKVPMFIKWAQGVHPGEVFTQPVSSLDLFRTTLSQVTLAEKTLELDGVDLAQYLDSGEAPHEYLYFRRGYNKGIRSSQYKMLWNTNNGDSLLYDLEHDPYENEDIYPTCNKAIIKTLSTAYQTWELMLPNPKWPSMIDFRYKDESGKVYSFDN